MYRGVVALAIAATGLACVPPKRLPIYQVEQRYALDPSAAETLAHPDAAPALAAARSVAFLPPDRCRSVDIDVAVGVGTGQDGDAADATAALACESAIGRLEAAALAAGYDVISWRALAGEPSVVDRAAEAGVDLLFVVDELTAGVPADQLYGQAVTRIYVEPTHDLVALRDPGGTAQRCATELAAALRPELGVVLDVQMVSVADRRVLWTYRHTHHPAAPGEVIASRHYTATSDYRPVGRADWKIVTGALGVAFGGTGLLTTSVIDLAGDADAPRALYAFEVALLGIGIYSLATIDANTHWRYSPADDVACKEGHVSSAADLIDRGVPPASAAGCDRRCRRVMDQVDGAVDQLFTELLRVRGRPPLPAALTD